MGMKPYKIRHPKKRAFLAAYRQSGNIRAATEAAGVHRLTFYDWTEQDLIFAAAARQAKEEFGDLLEAKLSEIALTQDNVTALIVALKMAGRFKEITRSEHTGADGGPIQLDDNGARDRIARALAELAARDRPQSDPETPVQTGS
jgi:hypothetical protein